MRVVATEILNVYINFEYDVESGLYHLRARPYNPETGTFLSEDPIGFGGGDPNLYRYVFNNPSNLLDPFGLDVLFLSFGSIGLTGNSPTSTKGIAKTADVGIAFDTNTFTFRYFSTTGKGTDAGGAFVGSGLSAGYIPGIDFDDFFGEGVETSINVGFGQSLGVNFIETSTGKRGFSLDFFGPGFGAGISQRSTNTCPLK